MAIQAFAALEVQLDCQDTRKAASAYSEAAFQLAQEQPVINWANRGRGNNDWAGHPIEHISYLRWLQRQEEEEEEKRSDTVLTPADSSLEDTLRRLLSPDSPEA